MKSLYKQNETEKSYKLIKNRAKVPITPLKHNSGRTKMFKLK